MELFFFSSCRWSDSNKGAVKPAPVWRAVLLLVAVGVLITAGILIARGIWGTVPSNRYGEPHLDLIHYHMGIKMFDV